MKLDTTFTVRCDQTKLDKFKQWSKKAANKDYQDMLREMMEAATEGRLTIKANKELKNLYK